MRTIKIIISPAKTMKIDNDTFIHRQMPVLLKETEILLKYLKTLNYDQLKKIWKCSDKLARQNFERIKEMDLKENLTPAIMSFQGLQYQYMGVDTLTYDQLDYIEKHLRILSGFYGVLKPFDGIVPYRLEMQSKLLDFEFKTLYDFWDHKIANNMMLESSCIINLASKEYSDSLLKHIDKDIKVIDCVFGEIIEGKVIQKATFAKMARGEIVRFMAEESIKNPEELKGFNRMDFVYNKELSDDNNYVFIK